MKANFCLISNFQSSTKIPTVVYKKIRQTKMTHFSNGQFFLQDRPFFDLFSFAAFMRNFPLLVERE
jgi:hypothetical protein